MANDAVQQCPFCREWIPLRATKCRFCREEIAAPAEEPEEEEDEADEDDEEWEDERPEGPRPGDAAVSWLAPVRVTGFATAAGYLGLFAWFPFLGFVAGPAAFAFGLLGLAELAKKPGAHGRGRCWFGIVMGALGGLLHLLFLAVWAFGSMGK